MNQGSSEHSREARSAQPYSGESPPKYTDLNVADSQTNAPQQASRPLDLKVTRLRDLHRSIPGFVLVHGAMDRSSSMRRLAKALDPFPVTLYDRRGYAGSLEISGPVSADDVSGQSHAIDLNRLCQERPTVVFGHSMGGTIAMLMATRFKPTNLLGLTVFEAPLPAEPWWPSWLARPQEFSRAADPATYAKRAEGFMRRMIGDENWKRLPPSTQRARIREGFTMVQEGASLARLESSFSTADLSIPVTSALGQYGSFRHRLGQLHMERTIPDIRSSCVMGSGHGAHLSHPQAVAETCIALLSEVVGDFEAMKRAAEAELATLE